MKSIYSIRKYLTLSLMVLSVLTGYAQQKDSFKLSGKIKNNDFDYMYLRYNKVSGGFVLDSVKIKNGAFQFSGQIPEPTVATIYGAVKSRNMDDPNLSTIFLEPTLMTISITAGDFKNAILTGSVSEDEQKALEMLKTPIRKEMEPILEIYRKEKNHEKASEIREQFEPFNKRMDKIDYAFFASHPDSYVSAYQMRFKMANLSAAEAKRIYNNWTDRIKKSSYGKGIAEKIQKLESGSPGSKAISFSAKDINNMQLNLSDYIGKKYVLIDFWASWCVPCRKGNPHLISVYNKYKGKGLEIIGVASDDNAVNAWKKAVEQDKIGIWKHVLAGLKRSPTGYDMSESIGEKYGIHTLPTKILIDKNGIIIGRYGGGGEDDGAMDKKLEDIFNQN